MRRLCIVLGLVSAGLIAGCNDTGQSRKIDAALTSDARDTAAGETAAALDSRNGDDRGTDVVATDGTTVDTAVDAGATVKYDSGQDLEVSAADAPADAPATVDGSPAIDSSQEDGGLRLASLDAMFVPDGTMEIDAGPDGPVVAHDDAPVLVCNAPTCWTDLMKDCQPAGTCRQQVGGDSSNRCYDNGVRVLAVVQGTSTMTTTVKNGTRTCWAMTFDGTGTLAVGHIEDGSGNTVATIADAPTGRSIITCLGYPAVTLNEACDSPAWMVGACASGVCNP